MTKKTRPKLFNKEYQKEWSEEYNYKHIHTGEHCTFESYIAEYLILRWTDAFKMDKPSYKFWTAGDKYHDMFMRNMKAARGLKKKYDNATIIAAIRSKHFENIYHVGLKAYGPRGWKYNQVALEAIRRYDKEHKDFLKLCDQTAEADNPQVEPETKKLQKRNKQYSTRKSSINKLRDL
jgi:histidinol phosphatase-like PHP family hydrolase